MNHYLQQKNGWFRGDFHAHTTVSPDGLHTPDALLALAAASGLDFFSITDHNKIGAWTQFSRPPDLLVMPGIEVTLYEGHWNVFPINSHANWMTNLLLAYDETGGVSANMALVSKTMQAVAAGGQINSINHPFLTPWAWQFDEIDLRDVHCLEIVNDPTWPASNQHPGNRQATQLALSAWTQMLNAGHRITAVGGTDYHGPKTTPPGYHPRITHPATYVFAQELSIASILQGLRERRVYISMGGTAAFVANVNGQTFDIGQDIGAVSGQVTFSASVADSLDGRFVRIVKNGEVLSEQTMASPQVTLHVVDWLNADSPAWYRLDVLGESDDYLLITNPIFAGPRVLPSRTRFGDFRP